MFSANYREKKSYFSCSLFLQASVTISWSRRALQDHYTVLLIGSQTAERLWRFVDSCIASPFQRHSRVERSKPICDRNGHLTSAAALFGVEPSTALIWFGESGLGEAQGSGRTQNEHWYLPTVLMKSCEYHECCEVHHRDCEV